MLRKTISIEDELFYTLQKEGILEQFKSFSDLVSKSLKKTIENIQQDNYKKQIQQMSSDPMVKQDIQDIQSDFKYADDEINAF
jgi:predicted CopG family antitoxin